MTMFTPFEQWIINVQHYHRQWKESKSWLAWPHVQSTGHYWASGAKPPVESRIQEQIKSVVRRSVSAINPKLHRLVLPIHIEAVNSWTIVCKSRRNNVEFWLYIVAVQKVWFCILIGGLFAVLVPLSVPLYLPLYIFTWQSVSVQNLM